LADGFFVPLQAKKIMEKMKRLNITMVLLFIAMIIFAKERPQVKYLEETELVYCRNDIYLNFG